MKCFWVDDVTCNKLELAFKSKQCIIFTDSSKCIEGQDIYEQKGNCTVCRKKVILETCAYCFQVYKYHEGNPYEYARRLEQMKEEQKAPRLLRKAVRKVKSKCYIDSCKYKVKCRKGRIQKV